MRRSGVLAAVLTVAWSASVPPASVAEYVVGSNHQLALLSDGRALSAGNDRWGQLGRPPSAGPPGFRFDFVEGVQGVVGCSAGHGTSFFWSAEGDVWACGRNDEGQLGDGTTDPRERVVQVRATAIVGVATGGYHTALVHRDGTVSTCGSGQYGALGDRRSGFGVRRTVPERIPELTGVESLYSYVSGSRAQLNGGRRMAWGYAPSLGDFIATTPKPLEWGILDSLERITDAGHANHVFAFDPDTGDCWGWGSDVTLQTTGIFDERFPTRVSIDEPLVIPELRGFRHVATGRWFSVGISATGSLVRWGAGGEGFRQIAYPPGWQG